MVKDTILEEEWGEFQSAEEVDIAFEIMLLFPDLYKVHGEVQEILDQKYEEVSEQNRSNFRDIDTQGFRYPEINLEDDQIALPRLFKTHLDAELTPAGAKYLYVMRDPKDAMVSFYHFHNGWWYEEDSIPIDVFANDYYTSCENPLGTYWEHIRCWYNFALSNDVMFLFFEDMKDNLAETIRRISGFMRVELSVPVFERVLEQSSFRFMKAHDHKFDEHIIVPMVNESLELPDGGPDAKVRTGRVGDGETEMSRKTAQMLDAKWLTELELLTGSQSYHDFRRRVRDNGGRIR